MKLFSFILLTLWSASSNAESTMLTFESAISTGGGVSTLLYNGPQTEAGFTLTSNTNSFLSATVYAEYQYPRVTYYTGSVALQSDGLLSLIKSDGGLFTANSIDLANSNFAPIIRSPYGSYPDPSFRNEVIIFNGTKASGATVSQTFTVSSSLSNYNFNNFDNLTSLNWSAAPNSSFLRGFQFDNINLSTSVLASVPEPETYATFLAGLGLIGLISNRRKNNKPK